MSKYDFKNKEVNDFVESMSGSLFISPNFISSYMMTLATALCHPNWSEDEKLKFYIDFKEDISRVNILSNTFIMDLINNLEKIIWSETKN